MQVTEIAAQILARAEQRAEIAAQNIANASTPGYRRRVAFSEMVGAAPSAAVEAAPDFTPGQLVETGNPADIGIAGEGFFTVRGDDATLYTRAGVFRPDAEGRLATAEGLVLQAAEGGDIVVGTAPFQISADGVLSQNGAPVARIALVAFEEPGRLVPAAGGAFAAGDLEPQPVAAPVLRQGMLESSNVNMGDEMVAMMEAVRRAETGQRLVTTYDDLMGRVLSTFGQQ